jgi:hypothetical protein
VIDLRFVPRLRIWGEVIAAQAAHLALGIGNGVVFADASSCATSGMHSTPPAMLPSCWQQSHVT